MFMNRVKPLHTLLQSCLAPPKCGFGEYRLCYNTKASSSSLFACHTQVHCAVTAVGGGSHTGYRIGLRI